ncbi:unnamed protein product [Musa hybrid cultivar]
MKKLSNGKGRRIHPTPPPGTAPRDHLAAIPAALLALVAALTAEEKEVLAYLLSGGGGHERGSERRRLRPHPPELGCECFCCYKSFWARWDASPNRHVIHRIIDAVEESLESRERERGGGGRRRRKRNGRRGRKIANSAAVAEEDDDSSRVDPKGFLALEGAHSGDDDDGSVDDDDKEGDVDDEEEEEEGTNSVSNPNGNGGKSSVRRFMSFIGARVWGVWN